jgi:ribosomal protein L29
MKGNDIQKLKEKSVDVLEKELAKTRAELSQLRFDMIGGKVKNVQSVREARKKIARIKTFIALKNNE